MKEVQQMYHITLKKYCLNFLKELKLSDLNVVQVLSNEKLMLKREEGNGKLDFLTKNN